MHHGGTECSGGRLADRRDQGRLAKLRAADLHRLGRATAPDVGDAPAGAPARYTLDPTEGLPTRLGATTSGTSTWYVKGFGQELQRVQGSTSTFLLGDRLGSIRAEYDASGTLATSYSYAPYGTPEGTSLPVDFGFTGEPQDSSLGLVDLRARFYSPSNASFLSRDPFAGQPTLPLTLSPYAYAQGNPISLTDPSGRCPPSVCDGSPPSANPGTPPGGRPNAGPPPREPPAPAPPNGYPPTPPPAGPHNGPPEGSPPNGSPPPDDAPPDDFPDGPRVHGPELTGAPLPLPCVFGPVCGLLPLPLPPMPPAPGAPPAAPPGVAPPTPGVDQQQENLLEQIVSLCTENPGASLEYGLIVSTISLAGCDGLQGLSLQFAKDHQGDALLFLQAFDYTSPPLCMIPVLAYSRERLPRSTAHIADAQVGNGYPSGVPQPMLLTYLGPNSPQAQANRDAVCTSARQKQIDAEAVQVTGYLGGWTDSCDEYPFATTFEGGATASTRAITSDEQNTQGGTLTGFYKANQMGTSNPFGVVPVDEEGYWIH